MCLDPLGWLLVSLISLTGLIGKLLDLWPLQFPIWVGSIIALLHLIWVSQVNLNLATYSKCFGRKQFAHLGRNIPAEICSSDSLSLFISSHWHRSEILPIAVRDIPAEICSSCSLQCKAYAVKLAEILLDKIPFGQRERQQCRDEFAKGQILLSDKFC